MRNTVTSLVSEDRTRPEKVDDIRRENPGYYEGLLGTEFQNKRDNALALSEAITRRVPLEWWSSLINPETEKESMTALKSISGDKGS